MRLEVAADVRIIDPLAPRPWGQDEFTVQDTGNWLTGWAKPADVSRAQDTAEHRVSCPGWVGAAATSAGQAAETARAYWRLYPSGAPKTSAAFNPPNPNDVDRMRR